MSAAGIRRLDLYDFFSVLLPGLAMILGSYPFLPRSFSPTALGALLPLLTGGFVFGRAIHTGAVAIEGWIGVSGHRDQFAEEIYDPTVLTAGVIDRFYKICHEEFGDIGIGSSPKNFRKQNSKVVATLYTTVRSEVHIDSRGRSRSFQAIYAFYRSMWFVSLALTAVYITYGVVGLIGVPFPYVTKIARPNIQPALFVITALGLITGAYSTFRRAKTIYRDLFVQYLIADFVALYGN
jgi:hypothetical protein